MCTNNVTPSRFFIVMFYCLCDVFLGGWLLILTVQNVRSEEAAVFVFLDFFY